MTTRECGALYLKEKRYRLLLKLWEKEREAAEERFNPNHDPKTGRFTSGAGTDGGAGKVQASAIKYAGAPDSGKIFEKDIDKTSEIGIIKSEAELKRIVGKHTANDDCKSVNPHYSENEVYQSNCASCVAAFELRRRGYDVEAIEKGSTLNNEWLGGFKNAVFMRPSAHAVSADEAAKDISDTVSEWGEGSRGIVLLTWLNIQQGHAITVENFGGNVHFLDPQVGEHIDIKTTLKRSKISNTAFFRTDNLELGADVLKMVKNKE